MSENAVHGLCSEFNFSCDKCGKSERMTRSRTHGERSQVYDINKRSIVAIRSIGLGLFSLEKFCAHLELPPPPQKKAYQLGLRKFHSVLLDESEKCMQRAAAEEAELTNGTDVGVSGDGAWQKRGHNSTNGVCSVIGLKSGKVIDAHVASKVGASITIPVNECECISGNISGNGKSSNIRTFPSSSATAALDLRIIWTAPSTINTRNHARGTISVLVLPWRLKGWLPFSKDPSFAAIYAT